LTVIAITYAAIAPLVLGFATIGLVFFYFAFRYNLLFVNTGAIDCKGQIYPRALQHTLVGCYLAMICLIGLFGIRVAKGPLVLMIVFLILCALYHAALNMALKPALRFLPRTREDDANVLLQQLQAEEGIPTKHTDGDTLTEKDGVPSTGATTTGKGSSVQTPPPGKQNFLTKFLSKYLHHEKYNDLVPDDFAEITYAEDIEQHAYYDPAVNTKLPILWVPRDAGGVSREECAHTSKITPITDEAAFFDEKGNLTWDMEGTEGRPPVYEEKIYY
jgi:calcium permeable stress-gated cation channel